MFIVDTNVLHAINNNSIDHERSKKALESYITGNENWGFTWGIIYEFFRVATHKKVFTRSLNFDQGCGFITELLVDDNCALITETNIHHAVVDECRNKVHRLSGNVLHNFHIAVLMKEHGIKEIITFDSDFRSFPWITCREP